MGSRVHARLRHRRAAQLVSEVRCVAASLDPGTIALCHEHACVSLERSVAAWVEELTTSDVGNSAAFAKALAREVRGQLAPRIVAQLDASTRPAVRRAATVAVLHLAESLGPLDLADWLWMAGLVLPPLLMLARKETDAAATVEVVLLSAALGGTAGADFVAFAAITAADCAVGRGPWCRLMTGALGERQSVWLLHRMLELGCQGALGSGALVAVLRQARGMGRGLDFCVQNGLDPHTRDTAVRSLRLLRQLLDVAANTEMHQSQPSPSPSPSPSPLPSPSQLQQQQQQQQQQPKMASLASELLPSRPFGSSPRHHPRSKSVHAASHQLPKRGTNNPTSTKRQERELSKIKAVLRQAVSSHSRRTLYGQPIVSWECAFNVIMRAEHGPVRTSNLNFHQLVSLLIRDF